MDKKLCKRKGCENLVISFSQFCGPHSDSRLIAKKLRAITTRQIKELNLFKLGLKKINFSKKVLSYPFIDECELEQLSFVDCEFSNAHFIHANFDECSFVNCKFSHIDTTDTQWMNCEFTNCIFEDGEFNQCYFDNVKLTKCTFKQLSFIGHFFGETGPMDECVFDSCLFTQTSINQSHFSKSTFDKCDFTKTSLHDSSFTYCNFLYVTHDFKATGSPILCDFTGTKFIKTNFPKSARKWNNFKLPLLNFYLEMVEVVSESVLKYPAELDELTTVLTHLEKLLFIANTEFIERIHELFKRLLDAAARKGDYEIVGNIINDYGNVPLIYRRNSAFLLPPPKEKDPAELPGMGRLILKVELQEWTLRQVSTFFYYLAGLENASPEYMPQIVQNIENGSITATLFGDLRQLLLTGRLLDIEKLEIEIDKLETACEKELLEIKKLQAELEHLKEDKRLDQEIKKLQIESQRLSLLKQKIELLEMLEKKMGINYAAYATTPEGIQAQMIAEDLRTQFPILRLRIEGNVSE